MQFSGVASRNNIITIKIIAITAESKCGHHNNLAKPSYFLTGSNYLILHNIYSASFMCQEVCSGQASATVKLIFYKRETDDNQANKKNKCKSSAAFLRNRKTKGLGHCEQ